MPQELPHKEASLFRTVVKHYEAKQYKKGTKAADQILKKHENHGDTQAMKALILNGQGQTDEAFALAKIALRNDMKSHVCWHVYGILYRHVKNFDEAIKAYKFALRLEPDSPNILRDLAFLQIQIRDYSGYIQSRRTMLNSRPQLRQHWTALAVAYHLAGDYSQAIHILDTYESTLKTPPSKTDIEHSEACLYKNTIIAESGDIERALEHLESIAKNNLDRTAVMEMRARYLLELKRMEAAEKAYRALLDRNNEYRVYYEGLEKTLSLDRSEEKSRKTLIELYDSYSQKSERVDAPRRIPLDFLEGDEFRSAADNYLRRMLDKGVPSTFPNVKALYSDSKKKAIIEEIVLSYLSEKPQNGFAEKQVNGDVPGKFRESVMYFLAQHYNYHLSRDLEKAAEFTDQLIQKTPSSVDYNMTRARTYKHLGDLVRAAEVMNHARELDERDRYINTKCAKYQLRNNMNEQALQTMSKFTRNETAGGPLGDLHDMQCMWFLTEDGLAYMRRGNYGLAFKRFKAIYDIFDQWQDDQFDFHSFSIRKGQIRAYVDMVRWENRLRDHPFYAKAAISAISLYIRLHDNPKLADGPEGDAEGKVSAAERKKAEKKKKRELEKVEAEAKRKEAEKKGGKKPPTGTDGDPKKEDPDPEGKLLVETKDPLGESMKYLTPLLEFNAKNIESHLTGFEVFIRRRKYLLAMKCLVAAKEIDPSHPTLHEQLIRFRQSVDSEQEPLQAAVAAVMKTVDESKLFSSEMAPSKANEVFLVSYKNSAQHLRSGLRVRQHLDPATQAQNEQDLRESLKLESASLEDAMEGLSLLGEWKSSEQVKDAYLATAKERWRQATIFQKA